MESTGTIDPSFPGPLPFPQLSAAATATDAILNNAGGLIATGFFSDEATTGNQVGFLGGVALDGGILFSGGANNAFLTQGTGYNTNGLFRAAAQGDGRVVFVGSGNSLASTPISYVGRMTTSGSFDPSFNAGLDGGGSTGLVTAQGVAPYTDVAIDVYGRIIVVGGGPNGWSVMRLWP
jgi:hypothetical protein